MSVFAVSIAADLKSLLASFSTWSEQFDGQALPKASIVLTEASCAKLQELMGEVRLQRGIQMERLPFDFNSSFSGAHFN